MTLVQGLAMSNAEGSAQCWVSWKGWARRRRGWDDIPTHRKRSSRDAMLLSRLTSCCVKHKGLRALSPLFQTVPRQRAGSHIPVCPQNRSVHLHTCRMILALTGMQVIFIISVRDTILANLTSSGQHQSLSNQSGSASSSSGSCDNSEPLSLSSSSAAEPSSYSLPGTT